MLVMDRAVHQGFVIHTPCGREIKVGVSRCSRWRVRLTVAAPLDYVIRREELPVDMQRQRERAAAAHNTRSED